MRFDDFVEDMSVPVSANLNTSKTPTVMAGAA